MSRTYWFHGKTSTPMSAQDIRTAAEDIAIERGVCTAEAFFHIGAVRSLHPGLIGSTLTCRGGAHVQDQRATTGAQAAHLLPGQILLSGQPIWAFAVAPPGSSTDADNLGRLSTRLQMCFAKTNYLPEHFNKADSQAEKMAGGGGLKGIFAGAVRRMWDTMRVDAAHPLVIDRDNVIRAMGLWFSALNGVYRAAESRKRSAAVREHTPAAQQRRTDEADVLAAYAETFQVAANPARFVRSHLSWIDQFYRWL